MIRRALEDCLDAVAPRDPLRSTACQFEVEWLAPRDEAIENAAKRGIASVWGESFGAQPHTLGVVFAKSFEEDIPVTATYRPETETIAFSLAKLSSYAISAEDMAFLYGAHEAAHAVQVARGEHPTSRTSSLAAGDELAYADDPHEREAWEAAMRAWKRVHPWRGLTITLGAGRTYSTDSV